MSNLKIVTALTSLIALAGVACNGEVVEQEAPHDFHQRSDKLTDEGLTITEQDSAHVKGTFARHDTTIQFELGATADGHTAKVWDGTGAAVVESRFAAGVEDTTLLGGVARVRGQVDTLEPDLEGDEHVFERLASNAAARLIPELKEALRVRGVDTAFYSVTPADDASGSATIEPQSWLDVYGYWHLGMGEYIDLPTWTFWGWTTFVFATNGAAASLHVLTPWYNPTEYTGYFSGQIVVQRQYAGYKARVSNNCVMGCSELRVRAY